MDKFNPFGPGGPFGSDPYRLSREAGEKKRREQIGVMADLDLWGLYRSGKKFDSDTAAAEIEKRFSTLKDWDDERIKTLLAYDKLDPEYKKLLQTEFDTRNTVAANQASRDALISTRLDQPGRMQTVLTQRPSSILGKPIL